MKTSKIAISVSAICATITALQVAPVFADQPTAITIKKSVQNQTTNSSLVAADTKDDALTAKTGDILKYVIELKNESDKDVRTIKISDTLPAGVELISDTAQRTITDEVETVKTGESTTKQILVKVTAGKDGDVIENQACYSAQQDNDQKLQGCDSAIIRIGTETKPAEKPVTPAPTPENTTPAPAATTQPDATKQVEDMPTTGPSNIVAPLAALGTGGIAYAGRLISLKRRGQ